MNVWTLDPAGLESSGKALLLLITGSPDFLQLGWLSCLPPSLHPLPILLAPVLGHWCPHSLGGLGVLLAIPLIQARLLQRTPETGQTVSLLSQRRGLRGSEDLQSGLQKKLSSQHPAPLREGTAGRTVSLTLMLPTNPGSRSSSGSVKRQFPPEKLDKKPFKGAVWN